MSARIPHLSVPTRKPPPLEEPEQTPSTKPTEKKTLTKNTCKKVASYIKQNKQELFTLTIFTGLTITAITLTPLGFFPLGAGIACFAIGASTAIGGLISQIKRIKKNPVASYGKINVPTTKKKAVKIHPVSRPPEIPGVKEAF